MVQIQNDGPRLKLVAGVTLEPGPNEVEEAAWRKCLPNKMTQVFMESRMIRVVSSSAGEPTSKSVTTPAEPDTPVEPEPMLAKDLIAAIKATKDMDSLHRLMPQEERRTSVLIAANARAEALEKAEEDAESDD